MSEEEIVSNIIKEAKRIDEDTEFSAKGHFNASAIWSWCHYIFGIPIIICATISGTKSLGQNHSLAAFLALIAAALGSLQTFVNAEQKASSHKNSGGRYLALRNNARIFREIELLQLPVKDAARKILKLSEERNTLNQSSLPIPRCAWWKAKKDIEAGYSAYCADAESVRGEEK